MEEEPITPRAEPPHMPKPTVWPMVTALAIAFLLWGLISSALVSVVGVVTFAVAITGWIGDIRHERKH